MTLVVFDEVEDTKLAQLPESMLTPVATADRDNAGQGVMRREDHGPADMPGGAKVPSVAGGMCAQYE